jgi:hypothetical protein
LLLIAASASPIGTDVLWVSYGVFGVLIMAGFAAIGAAWLAIQAFRRRRWLRLGSAAVLPVAAAVVALAPMNFVRNCDELGDVLRFKLLRHSYESRVASLPRTAEPRLAVFDRRGMPWAFKAIVYDETDEVTHPVGHHSPAWVAHATQLELSCGFSVRPLGHHFYAGYFSC